MEKHTICHRYAHLCRNSALYLKKLRAHPDFTTNIPTATCFAIRNIPKHPKCIKVLHLFPCIGHTSANLKWFDQPLPTTQGIVSWEALTPRHSDRLRSPVWNLANQAAPSGNNTTLKSSSAQNEQQEVQRIQKILKNIEKLFCFWLIKSEIGIAGCQDFHPTRERYENYERLSQIKRDYSVWIWPASFPTCSITTCVCIRLKMKLLFNERAGI